MEIMTLLKANIRHKKGSFVSIIVLMAIISMALTAILSVWNNIYDSIVEAQDRANVGDMVCMVSDWRLSEQLLSEVENHELVREARTVKTIVAFNLSYKDEDYANSVFFQELGKGCRLYNSRGTGFLDKIPKLKEGEIYISQGMKTNFACEIGDTLTLTVRSGTYDFCIAGIIEDPLFGASVIGWKNVFISHEDYERIYSELEQLPEQENNTDIVTMLHIYRDDGCTLNDNRFARQVNLDTGVSDMSIGTTTRMVALNYTFLFPKIICLILIAFVILLLAAVVVMMCHSVSISIEMEYTILGIMKAQGFTKNKIRVILAAQYLIAQIIGAGTGMVAAIPLYGAIGSVFQPITGILSGKTISAGQSGLILSGVLFISVLCIAVTTRKIAAISPVRAIAGGRNGIYFDSRIHVPIKKNALSASLAFRQFTSNKRQYAGVTAIVAILVYFMMSMMILGNALTVTSAWETMGIVYSDINIVLKEAVSDARLREIEETMAQSTGVEIAYKSGNNYYFSIDGEQMMGCVYSGPEQIKAVYRGRAPLYDNEIVMTEIAADNLGLEIGDKVTIAFREKKAEYMITGLNQHINDAGINFSITAAAASKLVETDILYLGYILDDRSFGENIEKELNDKYGDILTAEFDKMLQEYSMYKIAINAMTLIVYLFSSVFALVVVHMVCRKAFLKERRDIGIYKAMGFTAGGLRLQFAIRFLLVAVIGSFIGGGLAAVFSGEMLSSILRLMGVSSFKVTFTVYTFAVPVAMICGCFFLFAYIASRRVKTVEVKELVVE